MLLKDADDERRQALFSMIMTPPEARLTGDEEIDSMPTPSWWPGEDTAYAEGQRSKTQLADLRSEAD